jgi:hypothetical protein
MSPRPTPGRAAEVALYVWYIDGFYNGCGNCGGPVLTRLPAITWQAGSPAAPGSPPTDGTIGGIGFWAHHQAGRGWDVGVLAC